MELLQSKGVVLGMAVLIFMSEQILCMIRIPLRFDSKFEKDVFARYNVSTIKECAHMCVLRTQCAALSFETTTRSCLLHKAALDADITSKTGWTVMKSTDLPKDFLPKCKSHVCDQDEICQPKDDSNICVRVPELCINTVETCGDWNIPNDCNSNIAEALGNCKWSCDMCQFNKTI